MTVKDYLEGIPTKVAPEAIEGHNTSFHFDIKGEGDGYTLAIEDGKINVSPGLNGEAKCIVTAKAADFINIVTGNQNPMMALMMGKIKVSNQGEMLKYAKILGLM